MKNYKNALSAMTFLVAVLLFQTVTMAQVKPVSRAMKNKEISSDLFGLFFEDINYAADGGLYAEQVQNRSFEYNPAEQKEWNPLSFWEYQAPGFSYGKISVETSSPLHDNNPHYVVLDIEHVGNEAKYEGPSPGVGLKNKGFDGIVVRENEQYNFSLFANLLSKNNILFTVSLQTPQGKVLAEAQLPVTKQGWNNYSTSLVASASHDTAHLLLLATSSGKVALDVISLFPAKTFKNRTNGLRPDVAQLLADIQPRFIRFPGGCLVHGDGLGNMYRWKNTIGPIEQRVEQRNIWGYHQTAGLGYYEYFQFCEDINAKPLPVLPAAVSCQNSGGTWRVGGTGQKALPMSEMQDYIQEVLDLVEWANGPVTSVWGSKRAAAGHPESFHLKYIGIGNEDKITPEFEERFNLIYNAVRAKHPEIILIGTSGPFHSGEDYEKGWTIANKLKVPVIDEHYYTTPEWFISNQFRYDGYNRNKSQVYLGEYASWGNKLRNAIAEAVYMIAMERNGDVVKMASYAPLLAKKNFTQWKTDMIFFDNVKTVLTPNYYVQKMFSSNQGNTWFENIVTYNKNDSSLAASCVQDSRTGDVILKLVNFSSIANSMKVDLSTFKNVIPQASQTVLKGKPDDENTFENASQIIPSTSDFKASKRFDYKVPAMSLTVIRIKTR
ncbi:MAG: alpha-L-arabinofuranosidase C-terminal domain-containing protein [Bacteroidota bacterium]